MEKMHDQIVDKMLSAAKKAGADGTDITFISGGGTDVQIRLGKVESAERAEDYQMGLRVFCGKQTATISTSQIDDDNITKLAERAVAMAKAAPEDPYARLATADEQARELPDIELCDHTNFSTDQLTDMARSCEDAALSVSGITNSDGASASQNLTDILIATSTGFNASYQRSSFGFSAVVIAEKDGQMERDYDYSSAVFASDLDMPEVIGKEAARRTLARLGARKPVTGSFPILYDKRVSRSLAGHFASATNGAAIARGTSFLKDSMGEKIASAAITMIDDPLRPRGFGTCLFDGETLPVSRQTMIDKGVLQGWFLDLATAAQLGLSPTGHASRSLSGPPSPSPSNLFIEDGAATLEELIKDIENGFYVTELMGSSVSLTTGDYSRGAAGFWIENGEITWPAAEATIAGNLKDMFMSLTPANDSDKRQSLSAPSLRVDAMMVAGS